MRERDVLQLLYADGGIGSVGAARVEDARGQREERAGAEGKDKETESGNCRVNVAVCLAVLKERLLHQLQLRPKGLMDRTTQQGSRVRRPLSARANWSLRPGFTPTFYGEIHTHVWSCSDGSLPSKPLMKASSVRPRRQQSEAFAVHRHRCHLQWQLGWAAEKMRGLWSWVILSKCLWFVCIYICEVSGGKWNTISVGKSSSQWAYAIHCTTNKYQQIVTSGANNPQSWFDPALCSKLLGQNCV